MPVTTLPALPPRNDADFADAVEARLNAEVVFSTQLNALEANVNEKEANVNTKTAQALAAQAFCQAAQADPNVINAALNGLTAAAQANLAIAAAASAAGVLQQDLSLINSAALHRSPNAITAMFIYNTMNDSDGGAWLERMQNKSWYTEALNGTYLTGGFATELAARQTAGASTGSYYQLNTDGKFYAINKNLLLSTATLGTQTVYLLAGTYTLSGTTASTGSVALTSAATGTFAAPTALTFTVATAGNVTFTVTGSVTTAQLEPGSSATAYSANTAARVTEVFRGNTQKFPRLPLPVAEGGNLTVFDGTQAGRSMWGRWAFASGTFGTVTGLAAVNGKILASTTLGLITLDFAKDEGRFQQAAADRTFRLTDHASGSQTLIARAAQTNIVNNSVNVVAMTVLPDAPVDVATGLQIPTIAVGTAGGVSIIKSDGTVVNPTGLFNNTIGTIAFDKKYGLMVQSQADRARIQIALLSNGYSSFSEAYGDSTTNNTAPLVPLSATITKVLGDAIATGFGLNLIKRNPSDRAKTMFAAITNTYNTGWMVGDARRCYLSDTVVESIGASAELATATYTTISGADNITTPVSASSFTQAAGTTTSRSFVTFTTVIGRTYELAYTLTAIGSGTMTATARDGNVGTGTTLTTGSAVAASASDKFIFTATSTATSVAWITSATAVVSTVSGITIQQVVADRGAKLRGAKIFGTLTKTAVATAAQLVAYSGFSASNYIQEPYSADLDFGTGDWRVASWFTAPAALPTANFPLLGAEVSGPSLGSAPWGTPTSGSVTSGTWNSAGLYSVIALTGAVVFGKLYRIRGTVSVGSGNFAIYSNAGTPYGGLSSGSFDIIIKPLTVSDFGLVIQANTASGSVSVSDFRVQEVGIAVSVERSAASGAYMKLGLDGVGRLVAEAFDGTTTRTVTTTAVYNTGTLTKVSANYSAGKLAINVNSVEVASTVGAPLLTLNNSSAVLTIGNNYALTAPFPGSILLARAGATVPTAEQAQFAYAQELAMMQPGAQVTLPATAGVTDLAYDEAQDKWVAVQASFKSNFTGLIRTAAVAPSAGTFSGGRAQSGVELMARVTTNPGVDVTIPAYGLREELVRRAEAAARLSRTLTACDFDSIGFTATTTTGGTANQLTSVVVTSGTPYIGMGITGTGIPANTTITGINGTTYIISNPATAAGTTVAMGQSTFTLPAGYTAVEVISAGASKREGSNKDYVRLYDGFRETVRMSVSPGSGAWLRINAIKEAT